MKLIHISEDAGTVEKILGAAFLHVPSGYVTPPESIHVMAMFDPGLQAAAKKTKMDPDRFVARYVMDRMGEDRKDDPEFLVGFVSDRGNFYTRDEATKIALQNPNQPPLNDRNGHDRLDATDLHWQNESLTERRMVGAAYKDLDTGKVYGPAVTHGIIQNDDEQLKHDFGFYKLGFDRFYELLGSLMDKGQIVDGFLTDDGEFMTRQAAATAMRLQQQKAELGHRHGRNRDWLDSGDLTYLDTKVVEAQRTMAGAAMIDHQTGKVYGPGDNHYDVMTSTAVRNDFDPQGKYHGDYFDELMWDHIEKGRVEDGFVDNTGKWYTRTDAAKAVRFDEPDRKTNGPPRDWLDAWDLKTGFDTIHEATALGYSGYAINRESQQLLLSRIAPAFEHTSAHHITHLYGVPEEMPPHATTATVIAVAQNDRAQAAIVEINGSTERPNGQTYHITISYDKAGGASAKDSNQAIQTSDWTPVPRFTLPLVPFWKPGAVAVRERAGVPQATTKTLYHGTTVEIARKAMQHGLYPSVGDFVREFYGSDVDNLVFATDKSEITKATSAMSYHVARQLGISRHRLTSKQLYQNGAILVIRSGMDTNDHLYHRSTDDHLDYDDHPEQVEPGDYYGYEQIDPDYMLTGIKLKRFLTRLGLAQDKPNIMHPDQQQNMFIKRGQVPKPVSEDTESDLQISQFLSRLVKEFRKVIRQHLTNSSIDADDHFFKDNGEMKASFSGSEFGYPGRFKDLWIVLRGEHTTPQAAFHAYEHNDGSTERVISFAVLPKMTDNMDRQDQFDIGLSRMVSEEMGGIMLHELHHVVQDIRGIPIDDKGSFTHGRPDMVDYHNSPVEFDAFYQQLTHGFHTLLGLLRENPDKGMDIAGRIGYRTDFKVALESMLPTDPKRPEWGMWFYGKLKQNRRLIKRLYGLHQAILKEMKKLTVTENADHQDALDKTGFWGSAGAGCIIMAADTKRILLPRRSQWVQEPGTWGTWGGAIDQGEDPQEAALREVEEEAGYSGGVQKMIHLFRFQSGEFRYDTFLAIVPSEFEPNLNWETDQADWFEMGDFPNPLHFGLAAVLKDTSAQNKLGSATSA